MGYRETYSLRFLELLHDPHMQVRINAAHGLGKCEYKSAIPALVNLLADPELGPHAAEALSAITGREGGAKDGPREWSLWLLRNRDRFEGVALSSLEEHLKRR